MLQCGAVRWSVSSNWFRKFTHPLTSNHTPINPHANTLHHTTSHCTTLQLTTTHGTSLHLTEHLHNHSHNRAPIHLNSNTLSHTTTPCNFTHPLTPNYAPMNSNTNTPQCNYTHTHILTPSKTTIFSDANTSQCNYTHTHTHIQQYTHYAAIHLFRHPSTYQLLTNYSPTTHTHSHPALHPLSQPSIALLLTIWYGTTTSCSTCT